MTTKRKPQVEKIPATEWSRINARNSANSPWRHAAKTGSPRQRRNAAYFEALAAAGDTRRVPRPELD